MSFTPRSENKNKGQKKDTVKITAPDFETLWNGPKIVRHAYSEIIDTAVVDCSNDPGLTDESQAAELDINNILKRFVQTGVLPGADVQSIFADVSDSTSYHEAMNLIKHAEEQFMALDPYLRARFDNDPAKLMDFVNDPANLDEMIRLGIAEDTRAQTPLVDGGEAAAKVESK